MVTTYCRQSLYTFNDLGRLIDTCATCRGYFSVRISKLEQLKHVEYIN